MEQSIKQILESELYNIQKAIIQREVNSSPKDFLADRRYFKKTVEEKTLLANMKAKWLKKMRAKYPDFVKRNGGKKKYRQTLTDGEDI